MRKSTVTIELLEVLHINYIGKFESNLRNFSKIIFYTNLLTIFVCENYMYKV